MITQSPDIGYNDYNDCLRHQAMQAMYIFFVRGFDKNMCRGTAQHC